MEREQMQKKTPPGKSALLPQPLGQQGVSRKKSGQRTMANH